MCSTSLEYIGTSFERKRTVNMLMEDRSLSESESRVLDSLREIEDPEIGVMIVDLGLIYDVRVNEENKAKIKMTFTSMACPAGPSLKSQVLSNAMRVDGITDVDVEIVWTPKWDPRIMASEDAKMVLGIYDDP
jgi:metal-sulfur cluster biosynthetic enzyme